MDVEDMSWNHLAERLDAGDAAILPIGAGAKQHGWHLPMSTDAIQAEWLSRRLAERLPALVWPVVAYGHYPAFADYAGSCSLSAGTFEAVVRELVDGVIGFGARIVLVVDTGISTIAPVDRAIASSTTPDRVRHLQVYAGERFRAAVQRLAKRPCRHADEVETSIMLALAPDRVDMARAAASIDDPGDGPMQRRDPGAPNYSASGSIGDPKGATADKGRMFLDAMVEDLMDQISARAG